MNILFATSEAVPFAKTGGLADVCGTLPNELSRLGHETAVVMPAYRQIKLAHGNLERLGIPLDIPIGAKIVKGDVLRGYLPGGEVPVYFIENDIYFDRAELYRESGDDYRDNCERFAFFSRATLELIRHLNLSLDVIHCHDWQTSLIPAYLAIEYRNCRGFDDIASLLTLHNMAYQGQFWHWDMLLTGLDWKYFNWKQMEFWGQLNLLKTGIVFADALNTVSPQYAREIQTPEFGCGLDGVLHDRRHVLSGIINGVDYTIWNPAADPHLIANYDETSWRQAKPKCKDEIQKELGLPRQPETPLIGLIGRLCDQKGWDLVAELMKSWLEHVDVQWVVLGTGEPHFHKALADLAAAYPQRLGLRLAFSDAVAHRIEAGSDIFLMPSRYEPCGLNQLYSLKYGTVPVVHSTGGLVDTITDANPENLSLGIATGFRFDTYSTADLGHCLARACDMLRNNATQWGQLVDTGMRQDWSWKSSAMSYLSLYQQTISRRKQGIAVA